MRRPVLILAACVLVAACDLHITNPAPVTTAPPAPTAITISNTNTNTASTDRSDTDPVATPTGGGGTPTPTGALPLPAYGEGVTREYAAAHPSQVTHSCQLTDGEAAWAFLDGLIALLHARDARWGYLCKDKGAGCTKVAADVVAYKAGAGDTGFWIVDVLGNHCPGPTDKPTEVRWGVLPFELERRWIGVRP